MTDHDTTYTRGQAIFVVAAILAIFGITAVMATHLEPLPRQDVPHDPPALWIGDGK